MKMEISIRCHCGSELTFEDTLVDGRLEHPFKCTNCGADCTALVNEFIRRKLKGPDYFAANKTRKAWLGVFDSDHHEPKTEEATLLRQPPLPLRPPPPPAPNLIRSIGGMPLAVAPESEPVEETGSKQLILAGGAALLVGVLGAIGWLYIAKVTGYEIGYVAWALGALVGWASRLVAPRGHQMLGVVATLAAFCAIGGGQYLVSRWVINDAVREFTPLAYEEIVAYAKEIEAAQSSEELRELTAQYKVVAALAGDAETNVIAAYQDYQIASSMFHVMGIVNKDGRPKVSLAERDRLADAEHVTVPELAKFDAQVVPELKKVMAGSLTQADYQTALENRILARVTISNVAANAVNMYTVLWLFLGLGSAYRIARNAGLQY